MSDRLAVYGGTLAQLAFPAMCMLEFWRRRWTMSFGLCGVWLGQSFFNVALYVADARSRELPLAGFTDHPMHDWNVILSRWDLLQHDAAIATAVRGIGCLAIAFGLWFLWQRWL